MHSLKELTSLNYFSENQMKFIDAKIIRQFKDIAIDVSKRKCENTMGQMFSIKCALVKKTLLDWFNKKYRTQYLEISAFVKMEYERNNPVNWRNDKCVLCKMPQRVESTNFKTPDNEMSYGDFVICFKHKFTRNINTSNQIKESHHLETLENYYEIYHKFVFISVGLLSMFNNYNKDDEINMEVSGKL